jgi:hypothetical protein
MSVSRKETLLVIKQRILGFGLGLALLGSLVGFAGTANAQNADSFTVHATVVDTLILDLNLSSIDFGSNLNFLGQGAGSGIGVCTNPAETGGLDGARFVSPNLIATVWSNKDYRILRTVSAPSATPGTDVLDLANRSRIAEGTFDGCGVDGNAGKKLTDPTLSQYMVQNQPEASGATHAEFFLFDVEVDSPAGEYSFTAVYTASAQP